MVFILVARLRRVGLENKEHGVQRMMHQRQYTSPISSDRGTIFPSMMK